MGVMARANIAIPNGSPCMGGAFEGQDFFAARYKHSNYF